MVPVSATTEGMEFGPVHNELKFLVYSWWECDATGAAGLELKDSRSPTSGPCSMTGRIPVVKKLVEMFEMHLGAPVEGSSSACMQVTVLPEGSHGILSQTLRNALGPSTPRDLTSQTPYEGLIIFDARVHERPGCTNNCSSQVAVLVCLWYELSRCSFSRVHSLPSSSFIL